MREHGLVCLSRDVGAHIAELFQRVDEQERTVPSMAFYNARFVEVQECGSTILEDFMDPSGPQLFQSVNVPFVRS